MERKKWTRLLIYLFLLLMMAGLAAPSAVLLYRYAQYGQQCAEGKKETQKQLRGAEETQSLREDKQSRSEAAMQTADEAAPDQQSRGEEAMRTADEAAPDQQSRSEAAMQAADGAAPGKQSRSEEAMRTADEAAPGKQSQSEEAIQTADEAAPGKQSRSEDVIQTADENATNLIRVCIMDQDFSSEYHKAVTVCKSTGEKLELQAEQLADGQSLRIESSEGESLVLESIRRGDGAPAYTGALCLTGTPEGILVVNELPLEEYLYGVVSSEMQSSYPEEALKAQAVCARTYALQCMERSEDGAPQGDLNDSVSYQVYNNYRSTMQSRAAVDATRGEVLPDCDVQYYSTSCLTEHRSDLDDEEAFRQFLDQEPEAEAQFGSPWLRWRVEIPAEHLAEKLKEAAAKEENEADADAADPKAGNEADADTADPKAENEAEIDAAAPEAGNEAEVDAVCPQLLVTARRGDGQVQSLTAVLPDGTELQAEGEYEIRRLLGGTEEEIRLRDGSAVCGMQLLPSAFFCIEMKEECVLIRGGGYGHGNGMSQCGAAEMAAKGLDYRAILEYYYGVRPEPATALIR